MEVTAGGACDPESCTSIKMNCAGFAFSYAHEAKSGIERLVDEYEDRRAKIASPSLSDVAQHQPEVLGDGR